MDNYKHLVTFDHCSLLDQGYIGRSISIGSKYADGPRPQQKSDLNRGKSKWQSS